MSIQQKISFDNRQLEKKFRWSLMISFSFLLIVAAITFLQLNSIIDRSLDQKQLDKQIRTLELIKINSVKLYSEATKYAFTGDKNALIAWKNSNHQIELDLSAFKISQQNIALDLTEADSITKLVSSINAITSDWILEKQATTGSANNIASQLEQAYTQVQILQHFIEKVLTAKEIEIETINQAGAKKAFITLMLFMTLVAFFSLLFIMSYISLVNDQREKRLLNEKLQYQASLINTVQDAIFSIDNRLCIKSWNNASQLLYGYKESEVIGQHLKILKCHLPGQASERFINMILETESWNGLLMQSDKMNNQLQVLCAINKVKDDSGEMDEFVFANIDATELSKTQAQLENINIELEHRVDMRTIELNELNKALSHEIDIRKLKESELTIVANRLLKAQEIAKMGDWRLDIKNGSIRCSSSLRAVFEVSGIQNPLLLDFYNLFEDAGSKELRSAIDETKALKTAYQIDLEFITPKGEMKFLQCTGIPDIDITGNVVSISNTIVDITDRKKLEIEYQKLASIVTNSSEFIAIFDLDGTLLFLNEGGARAIGAPDPAPLIGKSVHQFLFEKDIEEFDNYWIPEIKSKRKVSGEFRAKNFKTLEVIPYSFISFTIETTEVHNPVCVAVIARNISKNLEAQKLLEESEQNFKALFYNNPVPLYIIDRSTRNILDVNHATLDHYGYSREEFLNLGLEKLRPNEEIERFAKIISQPASAFRKTTGWKHLKKNGEIIFVDITIQQLAHLGENIALVAVSDVTKQHRDKLALSNINSQLRNLTSHLQHIREEERKKISREIHDELGQLLTALKLDISFINKKLPREQDKLREKSDDAMTLIDESIKTMRRMASDLRPGILDDLGLEPAIEWLCGEFQKRNKIKYYLEYDLTSMDLGDEISTCLFRVAQESLNNISKHSDASVCKISVFNNEDDINMVITDDGVGFELSEVAGNYSLGLLGMRERVTNLNGEFEVEGKPGKGTRVKIQIPVKKIEIA